MTPCHPGDFIRTEVVLLNGHAALSPEMALRIEKAFGVHMGTLLSMQAWYDAARMRARSAEIPVERYESD